MGVERTPQKRPSLLPQAQVFIEEFVGLVGKGEEVRSAVGVGAGVGFVRGKPTATRTMRGGSLSILRIEGWNLLKGLWRKSAHELERADWHTFFGLQLGLQPDTRV